MLENIVTIFFSIIETIAAIFICSAFLNEKKDKSKFTIYIVICVVSVFFILWNMSLIKVNVIYRIIIVFMLYLWMIHFLYEGKIISKITLLIISFVLFYTVDILAVGITMLIFDTNYMKIMTFSNVNILVSMLSKLISLSVAIVINKINVSIKRESHLSTYDWIQLVLFPAVTFLILLVFIESVLSENKASPLMIISVMFIIFANVVIFVVINRLENDKRIKEENVILQQQIKTEMSNVVALMDAYDEQRKMTHDFSNHLSIIESLVEQNEFNKLNTYINALSKNLKGNVLPVKTNNVIIDAILNQKYNFAVKNNIMIEFHINDLSNFPMKDEDLVIVLTNALDNALEACLKLIENRIIQVKITDSDADAIISIKNTYSKDLYEKSNRTKNAFVQEHGFGLKNISTIVKKYNSYPVTKNNDIWFQITIRIPKQ